MSKGSRRDRGSPAAAFARRDGRLGSWCERRASVLIRWGDEFFTQFGRPGLALGISARGERYAPALRFPLDRPAGGDGHRAHVGQSVSAHGPAAYHRRRSGHRTNRPGTPGPRWFHCRQRVRAKDRKRPWLTALSGYGREQDKRDGACGRF